MFKMEMLTSFGSGCEYEVEASGSPRAATDGLPSAFLEVEVVLPFSG